MKQEYIDSIKNAMSENFYDKTLELYNKVVENDNEGGKSSESYSFIQSFNGNAQISNSQLLQKQYGLEVESDYTFTFNYNVSENQFIKYNNKYYGLIKVLIFESHTLALGKVI